MAEDWDLQAVVRSCSTAVNSSTVPATATAINNNNNNNPVGDALFSFASLGFDQKHEDPFCFPNLLETRNESTFDELEQFYKPYFTTSTITHIASTSSIFDLRGFTDQQQHIQQQQQEQQQQQPQQQQQQIQFQRPRPSSALTIGPRPRRRKNEQKRVVCQLTTEDLSNDLWAWRKYGQKPIKGSPYPRNYYRCSSSKGCAARKQVERSPTEPNMFIVSYTGEHTHPRPTHRNSLAGSTRNKFSTIDKPNSGDDPEAPVAVPCCSSSPISSSSLSPTTPLTASMEDELANQNKNKDAEEEEGNNDEMEDDDCDDENLLIPNMAMSEDIRMSFQELGSGMPGTMSNLSSASFQAKSRSSWAPSSSVPKTPIGGGSGC